MPSVANFLDTNILVYALGEDAKATIAQSLMDEPFVIGVQALNEFANVGRKKLKLSLELSQQAIDDIILMASAVVVLDTRVTNGALALVRRYNLAFYDALMVAAALDANCSRYYSEDLQHGLLIEGKLEIVNPFLS